jgi:hypothetical protein
MRDILGDIENHASLIREALDALCNAVAESSEKEDDMLSELKAIRQAILGLIVMVGFAAASIMFWFPK